MLAYYPHPSRDFSMQAGHYQQPSPPSTSLSFDTFDSNITDLSTYFEALDDLQDTHMSSFATQNPPIRVQQSSPPAHTRVAAHKTIRGQSNLNNNATRNDQSVGLLSPVHLHQSHPYTNGGHKRASSGSSVTSAAPTSPHDHPRSYPQAANSADAYSSPSAPEYLDTYSVHSNYPKSLPTPIDTPVSNGFYDVNNNFSPVRDADLNHQISLEMRRVQYYEAPGEDDAGSYQNSVAQSVSSMSHNSPRTPLTSFPDDYDEAVKGLQPDFTFQVPMSRSVSGMRDDLLMDSPSPTSAPQQKQRQSMNKSGGLLDSHYRTVLQHAQKGHTLARSQSSSTTLSGDQSPFRKGSEFAAESARAYAPQRSPQPRMTASQLRQQQKAGEDAMEFAQHQRVAEKQPKTISPKDAVYDYHQTPEEAAMPLFPPEQRVQHYNYSTPLTLQQSMTSQPEHSYGAMSTTRGDGSNFSAPDYSYLPSQSQAAQAYGFADPLMREESMQSHVDRMPEFPAQLHSMESSLSEMTTPSVDIPQRPADTSSDTGTYSCTYHGCPQRFESPAKLQKHKREAHRQTTPSGMTSMASRNSQAGPHKCTRINPSTGKPCSSEFSRPYDLTRHEDTIHNSRKMKVRCHLCTEEKTFSRNDALTRHMRVVHPDVDWPGKTRRKNARD